MKRFFGGLLSADYTGVLITFLLFIALRLLLSIAAAPTTFLFSNEARGKLRPLVLVLVLLFVLLILVLLRSPWGWRRWRWWSSRRL